ncbi:MAG: IS1595 family transposase [Bacteroidota bacterium]
MENSVFKKLLLSLGELTYSQERILREQLQQKAERKRVSNQLETAYEAVVCPYCDGLEVVRWGKRNDMQRYRCKSCKRTFNSLTGTPLARLRRKGHWLDYAGCLKEGMSVRKAATVCDVHPTTAFRWRHRFLKNSTPIKAAKLQGIVEANEMYFRRSMKGMHKAKEHSYEVSGRSSDKDRVCVFVSRDRNHNVFDEMVEEFTNERLKKILQDHLAQDILFCSDNRTIYREFTRENRIRHGFINLERGEWVKKDIVHINYVIAYQERLREWILNHFRGVATKYLPHYLAWLRELDEFNNNPPLTTILLRAKEGGVYKDQPITRTDS